jgi:hypothetical protein
MATHKRSRQRATHVVARPSIIDIQTRLRDNGGSDRDAQAGGFGPTEPAVETAPVDLETMVRVAEAELGELLADANVVPVPEPAREPVVPAAPPEREAKTAEERLAAIDARLAELERGIEEYFTRLEPAARRRIVNSDPATDSSVADLQRVIDQRLVKRRSRNRSR